MYKLLIVDDEPIIRKGLMQCLDYDNLGIEIIGETYNGKTALDIIEQKHPDIVFLDINMPVANGIDVLHVLDFIGSNIKVILITGYNDFAYLKNAIKFGAFDYILKPVDSSELEGCVKRAIKEIQKSNEITAYKRYKEQLLDKNIVVEETQILDGVLIQKLPLSSILKKFSWKHKYSFLVYVSIQAVNKTENKIGLDFICLIRHQFSVLGEIICSQNEHDAILIVNTKYNDLSKHICEIVKKVERVSGYLCSVYIKKVKPDDIISDVCKALESEALLNKNSPIITLAKSIIEENFTNADFRLDDIADILNMSPSHFSRLFKKETDQSFKEYLTELRIDQAIKLMKNPTLRIYEIAYKVGYSTQHYFSSAFKKVTGYSPSEYQKRS